MGRGSAKPNLPMRLLSSVGLLALLAPASAFAWGFDTHKELTSRLHEPLPAGCLKSFIAGKQSAAFQDDSCDPDRWRDTDPDEWPRHFLQIDRAMPPQDYPRDYAAALEKFGNYYGVRNGTVPWRVEEIYGQLVAAFQSKNETAVLAKIAHLSHYVTDAFSPLHDSQVTDPRLSAQDPDGLHRRFETLMLDVPSDLEAVANEARAYYGTLGRADPRHRTFDIVLTGQPLASTLAQADFEAQGDLTELLAKTRELTARRFGDSLTLLSSLVASAWVDAGSPLLASMPQSCALEVPQGELALAGHPLPITPDPMDAGAEPEPDAGTPTGPTPPTTVSPSGCSGAGVMGLPLLALLAAGLWRRRRS